MKAYGLNTKKIRYSNSEYGVVLGNEGESKVQVIIPCYEDIKDNDLVFLATTPKGFKIHYDKFQDSDERKENFYDKCWLTQISTKGAKLAEKFYTTGTIGIKPKTNVKVKAIGYDYQGTTAWHDYLLIVPFDSWIRVREAGPYNENECYWLHFGDMDVTRYEDHEIDYENINPGPPDRYKDIVLNAASVDIKQISNSYATKILLTIVEKRVPTMLKDTKKQKQKQTQNYRNENPRTDNYYRNDDRHYNDHFNIVDFDED